MSTLVRAFQKNRTNSVPACVCVCEGEKREMGIGSCGYSIGLSFPGGAGSWRVSGCSCSVGVKVTSGAV